MPCKHEGGTDACIRYASGQCKVNTRVYATSRKEMGICSDCGGVSRPGKKYCQICQDKNNLMHKTRPDYRVCGYKLSAKKRGLRWSLPDDFASKLMQECCIFCGYKHKTKLNGIDRVNNSRGYIYGNVLPCCKACNYAKHTMGAENWFDFMRRLAKGTENIRERVREYLANQTTPTTDVLQTQE